LESNEEDTPCSMSFASNGDSRPFFHSADLFVLRTEQRGCNNNPSKSWVIICI